MLTKHIIRGSCARVVEPVRVICQSIKQPKKLKCVTDVHMNLNVAYLVVVKVTNAKTEAAASPRTAFDVHTTRGRHQRQQYDKYLSR